MTPVRIICKKSAVVFTSIHWLCSRNHVKCTSTAPQNNNEQWEEKEPHGRYPKRIREADVDDYKTNLWLRSTGLKTETEGLINAAQDQSLPTKSYLIYNDCEGQHQSTVQDMPQPRRNSRSHHIWLSRSCKNWLTRGTVKVAAYIHDRRLASITVLLFQVGGMNISPRLLITANEEVTILWDMQIHMDRELSANKPDVVINKDHANRCCKLMDVSVPSDPNTSTKVIEKLDLKIQRSWD